MFEDVVYLISGYFGNTRGWGGGVGGFGELNDFGLSLALEPPCGQTKELHPQQDSDSIKKTISLIVLNSRCAVVEHPSRWCVSQNTRINV